MLEDPQEAPQSGVVIMPRARSTRGLTNGWLPNRAAQSSGNCAMTVHTTVSRQTAGGPLRRHVRSFGTWVADGWLDLGSPAENGRAVIEISR